MLSWRDICENSRLQDLPFKIETNGFDQIVMSPRSNWRGGFQADIGAMLQTCLADGGIMTECAVETTDGIKVPDVVWVSNERLKPHRRASSMPIAPEICVEIRFRSNSGVEIMGKMQLYFARGAEEVWLCDEDGNMTFYRHDEAEATTSKLCPDFPVKFEW